MLRYVSVKEEEKKDGEVRDVSDVRQGCERVQGWKGRWCREAGQRRVRRLNRGAFHSLPFELISSSTISFSAP